MKNKIRIFENPVFGQIRTTMMSDGQIGFVGNDVARVLGYSNYRNAIANHVDDEDKLRTQIEYAGQTRAVTFINESGLYSLILSSKLPTAREFKRWVTGVVLPQIRMTGGFIPALANESPEELVARALALARHTIDQKDALLNAQRHKVRFADAVCASNDTCSMAELAKLICDNGVAMGQNRLFRWMRDNHYLGSSTHHWNVPQQRWVEAGLFKVKTSFPWYDKEGHSHFYVTPRVTGKGQQYFVNIFIH